VRVVGLNEDKPDAAKRQIPLTLVIDPPADLACMTDEVFGPIIPVTPYTSMDEAIQRINAGPSPLGSYIATHDTALARRFIAEARSGGAAVNNFGLQGGHVALPFGGFGASGQGCHSAREGFLGYSHTKSVFHGASDSMVHKVLEPPLSELSGMAANGLYAAPVEG
jgi:coniferyl-aldehyde dehydrogenase